MHFAALRNWLTRGRHGPPDQPLAPDAAATAPDEAACGDFPLPAAPATAWPAARLAIAEELWGSGFLTPGGGAEVLRLAAPLGLSAASTLLLLGAGAGGPAQILATDMGAWVAAFEADRDLAEVAARRIHRAGAALAKRASVARWDPEDPNFRPRMAHHALVLDAIRGAPPVPVLAAIAEALKPHGQIVLVETVAPAAPDPAATGICDPAIAAWCALEGRPTTLADPDTITRGLTRLGFDVRIAEDISARHMRLAVIGWRNLVRLLARERPGPERAAAVVAQAELWTRRIRLMHAGRIRMMRWHAIGPAGGPLA